MTLQQFAAAGGFSLIVGLLTAFVVKAQMTKVAATTADATVEIKRLDNEGAVQNLWHDDLKAAQTELKEERAAHLSLITTSANLASENKRLAECNEELETKNTAMKEALGAAQFENNSLKTIRQSWEWMQTRPDVLRKLASDIEAGRPPHTL